MENKDDINFGDIVIDLGDAGAAQSTYTLDSGSGIDTITITGMDYSSVNTITLPTATYNNTYTTGVGTSYNWNQSGYTLGTGTSSPVNISGSGIDMAAGTDLKIDGKSLKEFMTKMEQRLAILVPDPAKLEKFEALKKAYEHYKTMESLCFDEPIEEESK
jgi:hypothetical protein